MAGILKANRRGKVFSWLRWCAALLLLLAGWAHYGAVLARTVAAIRDPFEDMPAAWLFPLVGLLDIWLRRDGFRKVAGLPSLTGFVWVSAFLALAWSGARLGLMPFEQVSLIGLVWSVPYALWGKGTGRLMLFPAWYLLFSLPVSPYLETFTLFLRTLAAGTATSLLNGVGVDIGLFGGTRIFYGDSPDTGFSVDVADACSGIRSLSALVAGTAAYAHFFLKTRTQRWMLFACSFLIAILGNILRILSICIVGIFFGQAATAGYFHEYSGYVFYGIALSLLFLAEKRIPRLISWLDARRHDRPKDDRPT